MGSQISPLRHPDVDRDVRDVMDALRHIVRALRVTAHDAERLHGLSAAQLFVLQQLAAAPSPRSLGELALLTHTDPSSVSAVVQRLVEKRLVTRRRARDDARRAEIALAARGRALLDDSPESAAQHRIISALRAMPDASREGLCEGLRALVTAMGGADEPPALFFEEPPAQPAAPRRRP